MELTRQEVINELVNNNINVVIHQESVGETEYITNLLEYGFKGFRDYTDEELVNEYFETFDEVVKIKK